MSKKLAGTIIIVLAGSFLLYGLKALTVSIFTFIFIALFVEAWATVLLWAIFLGVCVRGLLEGLHIIKHHIQPPVVAVVTRRVGHIG